MDLARSGNVPEDEMGQLLRDAKREGVSVDAIARIFDELFDSPSSSVVEAPTLTKSLSSKEEK
eukprot:9480689-Ditylum_brightwellii.AAC.1